MKKKTILSIIEIILPIILFIILLVSKLSDNLMYIIMMSAFIGWAIPYFVILISGIAILKESHHKLALTINILAMLLDIVLLVFSFELYNKKMIVPITEYIILLLVSIINIIYYVIYMKKNPSEETKKIKRIKKDNNGAIVWKRKN